MDGAGWGAFGGSSAFNIVRDVGHNPRQVKKDLIVGHPDEPVADTFKKLRAE